jgi:hypothetical protein
MFMFAWGIFVGTALNEAGLSVTENPIWFIIIAFPLIMAGVNVRDLIISRSKEP